MFSGKMPGPPKNPASRKPDMEVRETLVVTVTLEPGAQLDALSVTETPRPLRDGAAAKAVPDTFRPPSW
jgi:hypothetical protein